jgi:hypothetical protein
MCSLFPWQHVITYSFKKNSLCIIFKAAHIFFYVSAYKFLFGKMSIVSLGKRFTAKFLNENALLAVFRAKYKDAVFAQKPA